MLVPLLTQCLLQFLAMLAHSSEFENVAVREEELPELDELCLHQCPFDVKGGPENKHGKVNILLQVMICFTSCCSSFIVSKLMKPFAHQMPPSFLDGSPDSNRAPSMWPHDISHDCQLLAGSLLLHLHRAKILSEPLNAP